ncbi:hypothetical protein JOL62DRAFT_157353 [Phyllosticta paracitricarpa]|uniref:Secreted protein n=1 Tax=Phyllosticta paracitricarpa TaxID=2016321 RepID=A0ABR1N3I2_9PEZI
MCLFASMSVCMFALAAAAAAAPTPIGKHSKEQPRHRRNDGTRKIQRRQERKTNSGARGMRCDKEGAATKGKTHPRTRKRIERLRASVDH